MKITLPPPSSVSTKMIKKDPFQRLSLAVKKLDQLINRAHQLGSFSDQLFREDQTGPRMTPSEPADLIPQATSRSSTQLKAARVFGEKHKKS